ncbi:16S rRNA (uracil(1498)-N(3))-methyltransferase [Pyruvatibacter mobilis]|uniref:16S rRNA (uracil(1498)-N(3))-methyltransferase n=1 Tax=Pyruvatibacter mobilis TaxID=1712261 RepID=UPI003BAE5B53
MSSNTMSRNRANLIRLFVEVPLAAETQVELPAEQAHYVANVMRRKPGDEALAFNGRDGEWLIRFDEIGKKRATASPVERTRAQTTGCDLHLLFAPLKRARIDYMAQKATEMGASLLRPVVTRHTQAERVKVDRLRANAVEAAEQCNLLFVPDVEEPQKLETLLSRWPGDRQILFCDEVLPDEGHRAPAAYLAGLPDDVKTAPWAILIGPEGGFDAAERKLLHALDCAHPVPLGPRIMRADTAAVAAMALWQSVLGDWR